MENRFILKLFRFGSNLLRRFKPILVLGQRVIVTRYADVVDVLTRDRDFTIKQINAENFERLTGSFFLGMDLPEYERESEILQKAIREGDLKKIRTFVTQCASDLVDAVRPSGRIDVVGQLTRVVPTRLVASYLGVPGPDEQTMMSWMRILFHDSFLNPNGDPKIRELAEVSAKELAEYLQDLIAHRHADLKSGQDEQDDFLTRLVRMQDDPDTRLDDDGIRRNIGGVIVGAVDTTSKAVAIAIDELLRRPKVLQAAQAAAENEDIELVSRYAIEAIRFNPHNPILLRYGHQDTVLGAAGGRQRKIKAGKQVFAVTLSAMFDKTGFQTPGRFRVDRRDPRNLQFGYGLHACFGRYINDIQIPEIFSALLRLKNLRRSSGSDGKIQFDGPFPHRLILEFES